MLPGWNAELIAGKAAEVFVPQHTPPRFTVLYLHPVGLEGLSHNSAWTTELERHAFACCVPFGMRSWWANRVCPEFDPHLTAEQHLLNNVLPWMAERWNVSPRTCAIAGISMGGQGALRLAFRFPELFPVVAGLASALEYEQWYGQGTPIDDMYRSREACRQDTAILQIQPHRPPPHIWFACDPTDELWYRGNDRLHEKLLALGVAHDADLVTQLGGHTWAYFDGMAPRLFDWLSQALAKQSRRLL